MQNETNKIISVIERQDFQEKLKNAIPVDSGYTHTQFIAILRNEILGNQELAKCVNLINIVYDIASAGLLIGSMYDEAYILPFKEKQKDKTYLTKATLITGYKGYARKYTEAGYRLAPIIYTKEDVECGNVWYVPETDIWHVKKDPRGQKMLTKDNIAGGIMKLYDKNNNIIACIQAPMEEIIESAKIKRFNSETGKMEMVLGTMWASRDRETDFAAMFRKTLVRRISKDVSLHKINFINNIENKYLNELSAEKQTSKIQTIDHVEMQDIDIDDEINYNAKTDEMEKEFDDKRKKEMEDAQLQIEITNNHTQTLKI
jgi:hypothetical protein